MLTWRRDERDKERRRRKKKKKGKGRDSRAFKAKGSKVEEHYQLGVLFVAELRSVS